jgi:hypothetical protein
VVVTGAASGIGPGRVPCAEPERIRRICLRSARTRWWPASASLLPVSVGSGRRRQEVRTYLAAQFWRLARRIGKKKAAGAVGDSILVVAQHLLACNCDDRDPGGDLFVQRDADRARHRAVAQLQALGHQVTLQPTAAEHPEGFTFQDEAGGSSPPRPTT